MNSLASRQTSSLGVYEKNSFIPVSPFFKSIFIFLAIFLNFFPKVINFLTFFDDFPIYCLLNIFLILLLFFLSIIPFLIQKFSNISLGYFHPLVFIAIVNILTPIIKSPEFIFSPLQFYRDSSVNDLPNYLILRGWTVSFYLISCINGHIIEIISILFTYVGFSCSITLLRGFIFQKPNFNIRVTIIITILVFFILFSFLYEKGGVVQHLVSLQSGRLIARSDDNLVFLLLGFLPFLVLLFYAKNDKVLSSILFWISLITASILQFVIGGSRSSILVVWFSFFVLYSLKKKMLPYISIVISIFLAFLFVGYLGIYRASVTEDSQTVENSYSLEVSELLETTSKEIKTRNVSSDLMVSGLVPGFHSHLFGQTYIGALAFFIPRSIWPNKPRGAGAYNAAIIHGGNESAINYEGASYPISARSEAYWNFSYFGVIIIFFLYGYFLRMLVQLYLSNSSNPYIEILFILGLIVLRGGPGSDGIIPFVQYLFLLSLTYYLNRKVGSSI